MSFAQMGATKQKMKMNRIKKGTTRAFMQVSMNSLSETTGVLNTIRNKNKLLSCKRKLSAN